ncbi:exported hypothetical protein [Agrobacterium fabrum str. J-07]|nr:exported hypothetical protein [Agrobacterium fabrum str. J-07]
MPIRKCFTWKTLLRMPFWASFFVYAGGLSGRAYPSLPQQRGVPAVLKISSRIFFRLHGMKKDYRAS